MSFKSFLVAFALALSVTTNVMLATIVVHQGHAMDMAVALNEAKTYGSATIGKPRPVIPTVVVSPAAPPIHVLVPMPKPKPAVQHAEQKHKVHKHRKHKKHHAVRAKPASVSVTVTEKPRGKTVRDVTDKPVKKVKVKAEKSVSFNCSQLPSWIVDISPSTIRTMGSARGYSSATLEKVISCRAKMGGSP